MRSYINSALENFGLKEKWLNEDFVKPSAEEALNSFRWATEDNLYEYLNFKLAIYREGGFKYNVIPINIGLANKELKNKAKKLLEAEGYICKETPAIYGFICTHERDISGKQQLDELANYQKFFVDTEPTETVAKAVFASTRILGKNSHIADDSITHYYINSWLNQKDELYRRAIFDWQYEDYIKLFPENSLTKKNKEFIKSCFDKLTNGVYAYIEGTNKSFRAKIYDPNNILGTTKLYLEEALYSAIITPLTNSLYRQQATQNNERYMQFIPFSTSKIAHINEMLEGSRNYLNEQGSAHLLGITIQPEYTYSHLTNCLTNDGLSEYREILARLQSDKELLIKVLTQSPKSSDNWNIAHYIFINNRPELFAEIIDIVGEKQFIDLLAQKNQHGNLPLEYADPDTFNAFAKEHGNILTQHIAKQIMNGNQNNYTANLLQQLKKLEPEIQKQILLTQISEHKQNFAHLILKTEQTYLLNHISEEVLLELLDTPNNKQKFPLEYASPEATEEYIVI